MQITRRDSIKYSQLCGLPNIQRSSKMFKFKLLRVSVPDQIVFMTHMMLTLQKLLPISAKLFTQSEGKYANILQNELDSSNAAISYPGCAAFDPIAPNSSNDLSCAAERAPLPSSSVPMNPHIWRSLFVAVNERLKSTVNHMSTENSFAKAGALGAQLQTAMHECIETLAQLQINMPVWQKSVSRVDQELRETRSALACVKAELIQSRMHEQIARDVALHDVLTSLPNRTFLMWHLKNAIAEALTNRRSVSLLYVDLDGLKLVNDMHGHHVGDAMLQITASRLRDTVPADAVVCRIGGDEFVCLLNDNDDHHELALLAKSLISAISAELFIEGSRITVKPSIGIVVSDCAHATPEIVLKNADMAMYEAKRKKTGYVFAGSRSIGKQSCRSVSFDTESVNSRMNAGAAAD